MLKQEIINESIKFSDELVDVLFQTMDEYNPCDFETGDDYAESIIDFTLGRMGFDSFDDDIDEYEDLFEIILTKFGPTLMIFYDTSCNGDSETEMD